MKNKLKTKFLRSRRIRASVKNSKRPRLSIFRSNFYTLAQVIDDNNGLTLVSGSTKKIKIGKTKTEKAFNLGQEIAKKALELGVKKVVFDRGYYKYHGRVKAVSDGAREGGLKF